MLHSQFFVPCPVHPLLRKNEVIFFCATCVHGACQHCLISHKNHQLIQLRRYVYCNVVRCVDINPFVDSNDVQNYTINGAKVVFLNHRPHFKFGTTGVQGVCHTCRRCMREGYVYCSVACKVTPVSAEADWQQQHSPRCHVGSSASCCSDIVRAVRGDALLLPSNCKHKRSSTGQLKMHTSLPSEDHTYVTEMRQQDTFCCEFDTDVAQHKHAYVGVYARATVVHKCGCSMQEITEMHPRSCSGFSTGGRHVAIYADDSTESANLAYLHATKETLAGSRSCNTIAGRAHPSLGPTMMQTPSASDYSSDELVLLRCCSSNGGSGNRSSHRKQRLPHRSPVT